MHTISRCMPSTHRSRRAALIGVVGIALVGTVVLLGPARAVFAADTRPGSVNDTPATRHVPSSEQDRLKAFDPDDVVKHATPVPMPANVPLPERLRTGPGGPPSSFQGTAPRRLSPPPAPAP
jgi:hypothetical protein